MNFTKKFDRAFQWAGEKMGGDAHTTMSDDFKALEVEMALRMRGMEKLQRSMNTYVKWLTSKGEALGPEKDKGAPATYLGRTMATHGGDFEHDSEFGACLIAMGRANEKVAEIQDQYAANVTTYWLESLERSLAMMKEYNSARKKLESRRLAYDASMSKLNKAKRDDFRIEEELRANKAKYDESSEDVLRRMQDIKEAERDSVNDMSLFLDAQLDYHERCAEELRQTRQSWPARPSSSTLSSSANSRARNPPSRANTISSFGGPSLSRTTSQTATYDDDYGREPAPEPVRMPIRSTSRMSIRSTTSSAAGNGPDFPARPTLSRSSTAQSERRPAPPPPAVSNAAALRGQLRPVNPPTRNRDNLFGDEDSPRSGSGSPEWMESPATSFSSGFGRVSSSTSVNGASMDKKKAPPPPPPSRSKKPPPPVPARRPDGF